jgi:hypothetical protein
MENVSRRRLLRNGSLAVVGAGVAGAFVTRAPESSAAGRSPAATPESAALPAGASLDGPLVAHVKDLSTGEIGVYLGTTEVTVRDPHLAAKLYRAVS